MSDCTCVTPATYAAPFGPRVNVTGCAVHGLAAERDRLRGALVSIAHNDDGWCGDRARQALHPSDAHPERYEWRVGYKLPHDVGGIAAGTYHHSCHSLDHALNAYAHHMARATVVSVRIERREFTDWQPVDIGATSDESRQPEGQR